MMTSNAQLFSNTAAIKNATARALRQLCPPPKILPSEWAEQNISIPAGNAKPGPIRFDNAPLQRGMINAIVEEDTYRITLMTGAQIGKTVVLQCSCAYFIGHEPKSQIFVQPTQGDVQTFLETKLRPMLDANKALAERMAKQRGRDGVNNSRMISYLGGWLMFAWAGSPKTLRSRSAPIIQTDEIDGYEGTDEGDPIELAAQRSVSFGDEALRLESSTPTIKGTSRIDRAFYLGDQRRFHVACPDCGHLQYLRWEQVHWEGRKSTCVADWEDDAGRDEEHFPETAAYICEECGSAWDDGARVTALRRAEQVGGGWIASKPFRGHASFHAPELASTFRKLRDIVRSYLDKIALADIQSFVNVSLGEAFEETGESVDDETLRGRAEAFPAQVPMGGLYLTAGIDMQQDRLEIEIVAWGKGEESWSVDYRVLWGDPLTPDPWDQLDDILEEEFQHESGAVLRISSSCLDTGGTSGYTSAAYDYAKGRTGRRLFAIKGISGWGRPVVQQPQRKQSGKEKRKVDLFLVGVDEAKLIVMRRANLTKPGPGYMHTPLDRFPEWYNQISSEKLVSKHLRGKEYKEWVKPEKARNEGLDCRVYAYAALKINAPSMASLAKRIGVPDGGDEADYGRYERRKRIYGKTVVKSASDALKENAGGENPQGEAEEENNPVKRSRFASMIRKRARRRLGGF